MTGIDPAALTSDEALTALWKHLPEDLGPDHVDAPSPAVMSELKRAVEKQVAAALAAQGSGGDDTGEVAQERVDLAEICGHYLYATRWVDSAKPHDNERVAIDELRRRRALARRLEAESLTAAASSGSATTDPVIADALARAAAEDILPRAVARAIDRLIGVKRELESLFGSPLTQEGRRDGE